MGLEKYFQKYKSIICKYRIPLLILILGIALMLIPELKTKQQTHANPIVLPETVSDETALEDILSTIHGAGKVCVYVSYSSGEETVYQIDIDSSQSDTTGTERLSTVIIEKEDRSEEGLVKQINPPQILGVIVTCQGADRASVKLAIVDAVSKATGLGADCIAVLKMK